MFQAVERVAGAARGGDLLDPLGQHLHLRGDAVHRRVGGDIAGHLAQRGDGVFELLKRCRILLGDDQVDLVRQRVDRLVEADEVLGRRQAAQGVAHFGEAHVRCRTARRRRRRPDGLRRCAATDPAIWCSMVSMTWRGIASVSALPISPSSARSALMASSTPGRRRVSIWLVILRSWSSSPDRSWVGTGAKTGAGGGGGASGLRTPLDRGLRALGFRLRRPGLRHRARRLALIVQGALAGGDFGDGPLERRRHRHAGRLRRRIRRQWRRRRRRRVGARGIGLRGPQRMRRRLRRGLRGLHLRRQIRQRRRRDDRGGCVLRDVSLRRHGRHQRRRDGRGRCGTVHHLLEPAVEPGDQFGDLVLVLGLAVLRFAAAALLHMDGGAGAAEFLDAPGEFVEPLVHGRDLAIVLVVVAVVGRIIVVLRRLLQDRRH